MFEREPGFNPERALWCEVLLRTVQDALFGAAQVGSKTTRVCICEEARHYLTTPSADLAEVCALAGMDMQAIINRMRVKIAATPTPEELASSRRQMPSPKPPTTPMEKRVPFRDQPFTIGGETGTASEWCTLHGIKISLVQVRLNNGWTHEDAFSLTAAESRRRAQSEVRRTRDIEVAQAGAEKRRRRPTPQPAEIYTYKGESRSLSQWAEITGIGKTTLYARLNKQGMTFAQAIETPLGHRHSRSFRQNIFRHS